ncbi:LysR substrate-binding domain-containing protein [Variovorax saccharolyticus]|uniref:LysR substrate-binding domain-containing protein n=1 Tax=Variovorax saccharolyticus TaxID=3053516 RepID=UPI0025788BA5|nr:LysR substrate-binding domain-containing protein [Variovorax sp. J31P216]MDM0026463.1 LysR substrate-binding domain-containing protein [Variovorax sp. J31P216]
MDLRQLSYFVAAAEERNLGRAAERLHMSQPPLTRQIKALEEEVGAQLFERAPRGMLLTQAGEALLQDARDIFGLVDQAADRARRVGSGETGRIDVGLHGSAMFGVVPQLLARFSQAHPEVEVSLHHGQTPQQVVAIRQRRVLVAFERMVPLDADLAVELVARERLLVAVSDAHPFAGRESVPVALLRDQPIVTASSRSAPAITLRLCRNAGFEPRFSGQAGDLVMATLMTGISRQLALVPQSMANLQLPGVTYVPLETGSEEAFMEVHCFYRKDEASPVLQRMLEVVREFGSQALTVR